MKLLMVLMLATASAQAAVPSFACLLPTAFHDFTRNAEWNIRVFQAPSLNARKLGNIQITFKKGWGLRAAYINQQGFKFEYTPIFEDIEYGPHFDFSMSKSMGDWIQLPKNPFESPVWINLVADWKEKNVKKNIDPILLHRIYLSKNLGPIVFTQFTQKLAVYRAQYQNDLACRTKQNPNLKPPRTHRIPLKHLYDAEGHLDLKAVRQNGC